MGRTTNRTKWQYQTQKELVNSSGEKLPCKVVGRHAKGHTPKKDRNKKGRR